MYSRLGHIQLVGDVDGMPGRGCASRALLLVEVFRADFCVCDGCIADLGQQALRLARDADQEHVGCHWGSRTGRATVSALACARMLPNQRGGG